MAGTRDTGGAYASTSHHQNSLRVFFPSGPDLIVPSVERSVQHSVPDHGYP
jgi:hypothetical protein